MGKSYEGFYGGGSSSFNSDYGNLTGYNLSAANLGFPGSPQSANQVQDVVNAIKHGTKTFEVTMLMPDVAETIPKQHFEEMRALMKLTGVKPSVHGPLIDPAGFGEQGWSKEGRADGERRMFEAIKKAQKLDPSGRLPFVIHAANGAPGTEWKPGNGDIGEEKYIMDKASMINQETGQIQGINRDYQFQPGTDPTKSFVRNEKTGGEREVKGGTPGILFEAEGSIGSANTSDWRNRMTEVAQMTKHADEMIEPALFSLAEYKTAVIDKAGNIKDLKTGKMLPKFDAAGRQRNSYEKMKRADVFLRNAELSFGSAFHQAYKYGTSEQKKALEELSKFYGKKRKEAEFYDEMGNGKIGIGIFNPLRKKELLDESIKTLQKITHGRAPEVFKLTEDFAMEKASKTFGNLAYKSYGEFREKAPVLAIENMYQGMAFSRAEDMRDLVNKSRERFVERLVGDGMNKKKAERLAKEKLGVTWDVGHLNIMKKKGFNDKDVIEQTKLINKDKSMVKHIHLTDNFGYADTHLVPGMGNVPIKGILEELEKNGRFDEMRKITEAGGMIQHFKKLPHSMTLAAFGSGIYGMKNAPTWNQAVELQGNYFGGYGNLNPQTHHAYFGAGFTTMPVELGGAMPGGQSRFGGAPMA